MAREIKKSFCRICQAFCAVEVEVEDGRVTAVRGDPSDPMTGGYTCMKGRQMPDQLYDPQRLRTCLRRRSSGGFEEISTEQALDEIAGRLLAIIAEYGPRAVASYSGTSCFYHSGLPEVVKAWHRGIGSPSVYSSLTIDQPAKVFTVSRMGMWGGGTHSFASSDVALVVGNNPLLSHLAPPSGVPGFNPAKTLDTAKARGLRLICVDPRRSQTAARADIHLQIIPGEDATLMAAFMRVILEEGLYDRAFCAEHLQGLDELREAVAGFTPAYAAARCGLREEELLEAARMFAHGPRGCASSGTGPDMGPHPNVSEHLIFALNMVCGRTNRPGEKIDNPGVLGAAVPRPGQPIDPQLLPPLFGYGGEPAPRVRGLQQVCGEMPTTALAEEILLEGPGQVRALLCVGGNPLLAWPDQAKTRRALDELDLLVCIDPYLSATAQKAGYVLAPALPLERDDVTLFVDMFYELPYAHYTDAVVEAGGGLREDWEFFAGLAQRMGTTIELPLGPIDTATLPSKFELLESVTAGSRVALAEIRAKNGGHVFHDIEVRVDAPVEGLDAKLQMSPPGMVEEIREIRSESFHAGAAESGANAGGFTHLLICRRMDEVLNSVCRQLPQSKHKAPTNPAYLAEPDMLALGIADGDRVEIVSEAATLRAVARLDKGLRAGVVSMAHCWGGPGADDDGFDDGVNTNRLTFTDRYFDKLTGMARQTAIPVRLRPVAGEG